MANLIRKVFGVFWLIITGFLAYLAYTVLQTEGNPQTVWGWRALCALTFISVTYLASIVILGHHSTDPDEDEAES